MEHEPAGLSAHEALPHFGGVFGPAESDRVRRFVTWLGGQVTRRLAVRFPSEERSPTLLVIIDGWELSHDPADHTSVETSLGRVLREVIQSGPKVRFRIVVACGRGPLASKPADLFDRRPVLRFPQGDVIRGVLPSGTGPPLRIPGRAAEVATGRRIEIVLPAETSEPLVARVSSAAVTSERAPRRFP